MKGFIAMIIYVVALSFLFKISVIWGVILLIVGAVYAVNDANT